MTGLTSRRSAAATASRRSRRRRQRPSRSISRPWRPSVAARRPVSRPAPSDFRCRRCAGDSPRSRAATRRPDSRRRRSTRSCAGSYVATVAPVGRPCGRKSSCSSSSCRRSSLQCRTTRLRYAIGRYCCSAMRGHFGGASSWRATSSSCGSRERDVTSGSRALRTARERRAASFSYRACRRRRRKRSSAPSRCSNAGSRSSGRQGRPFERSICVDSSRLRDLNLEHHIIRIASMKQ